MQGETDSVGGKDDLGLAEVVESAGKDTSSVGRSGHPEGGDSDGPVKLVQQLHQRSLDLSVR